MRRLFKPGRYANVTATLALIVALGGTAFAATKITGKSIKDGSVTGADIKKDSIGTKQVAGLRAGDFRPGQLPAGQPGAAGAPGAQGIQGPAGPAGSALAYARVVYDGTLDQSVSQGITVVSHAAASGVYCLDYTGGTARHIQVTVDISGADSRKHIASGTAVAASVAALCPAGGDVVVATANVQTTIPAEASFYVAIIA